MKGSRLFTWWPSTAMYAVPVSKREGSMLEIVPQSTSPRMLPLTSLQCAPPSRVTCTFPSFVPAQISPRLRGDSAIAKTTPAYSTPMLSGVSPPEGRCRVVSLRVRSGLISFHVTPASEEACTCWLPTYTVLWSNGEIVSGNVHTKRYFTAAAGYPIVACGQTSVERAIPVRTSYRETIPPTLPNPDADDHTMFESTGSGVAHPLSPPPTVSHIPRGMSPPVRLLLGPRAEGPSWRLP